MRVQRVHVLAAMLVAAIWVAATVHHESPVTSAQPNVDVASQTQTTQLPPESAMPAAIDSVRVSEPTRDTTVRKEIDKSAASSTTSSSARIEPLAIDAYLSEERDGLWADHKEATIYAALPSILGGAYSTNVECRKTLCGIEIASNHICPYMQPGEEFTKRERQQIIDHSLAIMKIMQAAQAKPNGSTVSCDGVPGIRMILIFDRFSDTASTKE